MQIYDGRAWVQCDGRIWTGERWIPYSSYNVVTLSDMYDIADASGQSGYEYIYSESGFWSWFQKAWLDFRQWTSTMLSTVQGLGSGGGSPGGSGGDSAVVNFDNSVDIDTGDISLSYSVSQGAKSGFKVLDMILRLFGDVFGNLDNAVESVVSSPYTETVIENEDGTSSTVQVMNEDSALSVFLIPIE